MTGQVEIKTTSGEVVKFHFGIYSRKRFSELAKAMVKGKDADVPTDMAQMSLQFLTNIVISGVENERRKTGDLTPFEEWEAENLIDNISDDDVEKIIKAFNFFNEGEQTAGAKPPKKAKSVGTK